MAWNNTTQVLTLTGQLAINLGNATSILTAGVIEAGAGFKASGTIANFGPASAGVITLRANGFNSATGQVQINSSGAVIVNGNIELGHATDTTLSRVSAGLVAIEGQNILTAATGVLKAGDTMSGDLTISKATPTLTLTKPASGTAASIVAKMGANARWGITVGDTTAESGSNAGSNFSIDRYNDAGAILTNALYITRSTGFVSIPGGHASQASCSVTVPAATVGLAVSNTVQFVQLLPGDGTALAASGNTSFAGVTNFTGGGLVGTSTVPLTFADVWNTASGTANNMTVLSSGRICKITSMRAAKTDIVPLADAAGDQVLKLQPVSFKFKNTELEPYPRTHYGFIAEDLAEADEHFPSWGLEPQRDEDFAVVTDDEGKTKIGETPVPNGVDSNAIIAGLVNLVQRLEKRIAALEAT